MNTVLASSSGAVLAFDVGRKLIGVAIGNRSTGNARALSTITAADGVDWPAIDTLVREWQPQAFIVGLPLALDGTEQPMTKVARRFGAELEARYARPVHDVDERHTSQEASRRFAEQRAQGTARRKHAAAIDALAAQVILETWLLSPIDEGGGR